MKFWAIAGLLASAVLLTALVHRKEPKAKTDIKDPEERYGIEELIVDSDV
jgi:hypothetical protein